MVGGDTAMRKTDFNPYLQPDRHQLSIHKDTSDRTELTIPAHNPLEEPQGTR
jgi:hypothetical protein